ncbi:LTA synthase family protein [Apibacter muscae]|uniref:LTA synthase family protein n=1 Tax=Apibacter muscae TaxID=2509004 RepID=A0A563DKC9_9FLAO|nr:sulfatase-like hydrolase/transferase [Apibacter muscae]TWP30698.1 LTA synthase family protein [Apibacter muscae]
MKFPKKIILFFLIFLSITIFFILLWLNSNFAHATFEQILFHINIPDNNPTFDYKTNLILLTLLPASLITLCFIVLSMDFSKNESLFLYIKLFTKIKFRIQIYPIQLFRKYLFIFTIFLILLSSYLVYKKFKSYNVYGYFFEKTALYDQEYINPKKIKITFPEKPNNLIVIYLESMETTMQSKEEGGLFNQNIIPELTKLAKDNINFSQSDHVGGSVQVSFTGWTMAAIVASTSGIPLKLSNKKENDMERYKVFLPNALTLGDILEKEGYNNILMEGSDSKFSGLKTFFQSHGKFQIKDYNYFKENGLIPKDYLVWWGIEDAKLFNFAKQELTDLSKDQRPFAFVMNTMDTHFPNGYLDPNADIKFDNQYANVNANSSKQLYEFIEWLKSQSFFKNTTIIILGDHLSMDNFYKSYDLNQRFPYNCVINSVVQPKHMKNRNFTTFDWFPTIIESIGGKIDAPGLGLGRSLFGNDQTLLEKMGKDSLNNELSKNSDTFNHFWNN